MERIIYVCCLLLVVIIYLILVIKLHRNNTKQEKQRWDMYLRIVEDLTKKTEESLHSLKKLNELTKLKFNPTEESRKSRDLEW